jgi:uncharacterized protein YjbI with pentapeptide repeats
MKNPPNKSITDSLRKLQEGRVKQKNQSGIIEKLVAHRKNETNEKDVASEFENALTKIRDKNKNNARINFSWSDLSEIEFKRNPQLSYDGSSFFGSTISTINKKLTNLSFQNIDFGFAKLSWVDLSGANLTNANLSRANLTKADLSRTNLTGANLTSADLDTANLTEANVTNADLSRANLTNADLSRANLTGANLTSADLDTANLTEANLTNADLSKANLTGANLSGADLTGAKFRGVIQNTITLEAIPDFTELGVKTILYLLKDGGLSDNQKKEMLGIGNEVPVSKYLQGLIEQSRDDKIKSDVKKVLEVAEDFEKKIKTKKRSASFDAEDRNSKNGRWGARVKNEENIPLDQSRVR